MPKATMREVARLAGVSSATVSRALRNPELLKPETLRRIHAAIREAQYSYPLPPKNTEVSRAIGVLLPTTLTAAFADTLLGIQEAALENHFTVALGATNFDAEVERDLLERFSRERMAGLIVAGFSLQNEPLVRRIAETMMPCIVMWETNQDQTLHYVGFDNYRAFVDLTNHVIGLGHRRIGLICGPFSKSERAQRRLNGYRYALESNGLEYDPGIVFEAIPSLENGVLGFRSVMSGSNPPTAVLGGADMLALGALSEAGRMGFRVPGDISIAGFDDIPFAAYSHPPLTSMRVPAYQIGLKAVEALVKCGEKGSGPQHHCFETSLIVRESCAPPAHKEVRTQYNH